MEKSLRNKASVITSMGKKYSPNNNDGKWMLLYDAERNFVECIPTVLILGYFEPSFYARARVENIDYNDKHRDSNLIGTWIYHQTETFTSTVTLTSDGKGSRIFDSPIEHLTLSMVDEVTTNGWIHIKYSSKTSYTLFRYNKNGNTSYLYYADILEDLTIFGYHKQLIMSILAIIPLFIGSTELMLIAALLCYYLEARICQN